MLSGLGFQQGLLQAAASVAAQAGNETNELRRFGWVKIIDWNEIRMIHVILLSPYMSHSGEDDNGFVRNDWRFL